MKKSMDAIYTNITGKNLDTYNLTGIETMQEAFGKIESFVQKNGQNLEKVANIMQLQIDIEKALKTGKSIEERSLDLLDNMNFPMKDGKIQWIKSGNEPAFSGTIEEYINFKAIQMNCKPIILFPNKIKDEYNIQPTDKYKKSLASIKEQDEDQKNIIAPSPNSTR